MSDYFDKDGKPITLMQWAQLNKEPYKRVGKTVVGKIEVSTIWLGLNNNFSGEGTPLIFETMVFGGKMDEETKRYATLQEAAAGHHEMVARVNAEKN